MTQVTRNSRTDTRLGTQGSPKTERFLSMTRFLTETSVQVVKVNCLMFLLNIRRFLRFPRDKVFIGRCTSVYHLLLDFSALCILILQLFTNIFIFKVCTPAKKTFIPILQSEAQS